MPYVPPHKRVAAQAAAAEPPPLQPTPSPPLLSHPSSGWGLAPTPLSSSPSSPGTRWGGGQSGRGGGRQGWGRGSDRHHHHHQQQQEKYRFQSKEVAILNSKRVVIQLFVDDRASSSDSERGWFTFVPYTAQTYQHLRDDRPFLLQPAEPPRNRQGTRSRDEACSDGRGDNGIEGSITDKTDSLASGHAATWGSELTREEAADLAAMESEHTAEGREADQESSVGPPLSLGSSLLASLRGPLEEALHNVHATLSALAASSLRHSTLERPKILVRPGRCLFMSADVTRQDLESHAAFSSGQIEAQMGRTGRAMAVPLRRAFETHLPEDVFAEMERMVMENTVGRKRHEKYLINVDDTDQHRTYYKLVCEPKPDGDGLVLVKVKSVPMRCGVIDVVRPEHKNDFRFMLITESFYTSVSAECERAFEHIVSKAQIDPTEIGGLHWPLDAGVSTGRFVVRSVRHSQRVSCASMGKWWKLTRVNGAETKSATGGRLTSDIEFCPLVWRSQFKGLSRNSAAPSELPGQASEDGQSSTSPSHGQRLGIRPPVGNTLAPTWTPESILATLPELLLWITVHIP